MSPKNYLFICDSSTDIGGGHVARCVNLAHKLSTFKNASCTFFHRQLSGSVSYLITEAGFPVIFYQNLDELKESVASRFSAPVDLIVFDSYQIDINIERILSPFADRTLVIDDVFDRRHECTMLLNQNLLADASDKYQKLVNVGCKLFLGPEYALISDVYLKGEKSRLRPDVKRILIFMGSTDPVRGTIKLLKLCQHFPEIQFNFVVGRSCLHKTELIEGSLMYHNAQVSVQVPSLLPFFLESDLFVGAGGSVSWERLTTNLPGITVSVAQNQVEMSESLGSFSLQSYLGHYDEVDLEQYCESIRSMSFDRRQFYWDNANRIKIGEKLMEIF